MTIETETMHGAKLQRLLRLRELPSLRDLVPAVYPIAPLDAEANAADYAAALRAALPDLADAVARACGPAPWIVRSAGIEDLDENINAGGYDSLVCASPHALVDTVAAVALSGAGTHARRQQALAGAVADQPIPCFVQPLLPVAVAADVGRDHSPWLEDAVLDRIESVSLQLIELFDFAAIDCEWGIETDLGLVSVTTIMPRDASRMHVAHTLGFGFSSAQNTGARATSLCLRVAGTDLRLWRARHLRQAGGARLHLLQARPARVEPAMRTRQALTDECYTTLVSGHESAAGALIYLGAAAAGHALVAPDLMTAWRRYLALAPGHRASIAVVLVDEGSAEEHAGIMFRQHQVTCIRMDTRAVPPDGDCVVFERGTCILGDATLLKAVRTEQRQELVLPDGCAWLAPAVAAPHDDGRIASALARLRHLPLERTALARLLARTELPAADFWLEAADGTVASPSLLGRALGVDPRDEAALAAASGDFAQRYARAAGLARGAVPDALPALAALGVEIDALAASGDLRIAVALLDCEAAAARLPAAALRKLLLAAAAQLAAGRRELALLMLASVAAVEAECARLPVYEADEVAQYIDTLADAFEHGLSAQAWTALRLLELPVAALAVLAARAAQAPALVDAVQAFGAAAIGFRGIAADEDVITLSASLNGAYQALRESLRAAGVPALAEQIRSVLIETYDASLKGLLTLSVESRDPAAYQRYLAVMRQWIALLEQDGLCERDVVVLALLRDWLGAWQDEPMPASFEIEDRNWRLEFDTMAAAGGDAERYENPHVLHNLLHQWSLAGLRLDTGAMPRRVRALEHFCSTFSSRATKVLRFERELLEIQIPMGTHKASYVLTPRQATVEWTEPPDCPEEELARLDAFELILARLRDWSFPALTVRRERVLGTWTLFLRLRAPDERAWHFDELRHFIAATRFLFDASYDFSYVPNEVVDGLAASLAQPQWESVFATLIGYRAVIEDTAQYIALHTLPMSSAVGALAQSAGVRGLLLRCQRRGPRYCWGLIDALAHWLEGEQDAEQWTHRYELLRQASLWMAAAWPREALAVLGEQDGYHAGHDLVAACLMKRADLRAELLALAAQPGTALAGVPGLIARHAPEILLEAGQLERLAGWLADAPPRYRRARHLVVAHRADALAPALLARLLQGMDTVPWGASQAAEQAIRAHEPVLGPWYRFPLERGVDWATLDSWSTSGQAWPAASA